MSDVTLGALARRFVSSGVFWTGLVTVLRSAGFVLVLPVVLKRLPTDEVGLWYVFGGIAGLCGMVEMGFAPVISRFASYYLAGFRGLPGLEAFDPARQEEGINRAGIAGLVRMADRLYRLFALVILVAMSLGGYAWLAHYYGPAMAQPRNQIAFWVATLGVAGSMTGFFWTGLLFGINRVQDYQKAVLGGITLNYGVILLGLALHWGLLALVLGQLTLSFYQRWRCRIVFLKHCPIDREGPALPIGWRHLWPMTWRGGLMGFGMYLASATAVTLVCGQLFGLETTARYALSIQLMLVPFALGNTWVLVKYPLISTLYVQGRLAEIRKIVAERLLLQTLSYAVLCALAWKWAPPLLGYLGARTNFLEPRLLALVMAVGAVDLFVGAVATVVQSGNQFPFVKSKLLNGTLTMLLAWVLGKWLGLAAMICAPALAQCLYNGWYVTLWCWKDLYRTVPETRAPAGQS